MLVEDGPRRQGQAHLHLFGGGIGEREKCLVEGPVVASVSVGLLPSEHSLHVAGSSNPHLCGPRPRPAEDWTHFAAG